MIKAKKSIDFYNKIKHFNGAALKKVGNIYGRFAKKIEGTMVENWIRYWKQVGKDYRDVGIDVSKDIKEKPSKAILIGSSMGLITYFWRQNPNATHFRDAFLKANNDICLLPQSLVKQDTITHLKYIEKCYNNNLIRYTSFGIMSIIWVDNFSDQCSAFETQCSYLQIRYTDILNRIVDIGLLNNWWILTKKMTDYDINY